MFSHSNRRSAFTLIELLVVVAIIALLISILLPSLNRAREQTKALVCLSNLRSLGQALIAYDAETGRLPRSHQAIYRNTTVKYWEDRGFTEETARRQNSRFLSTILRPFMNVGADGENSAVDKIATCPVMTGRYNSEDSFEQYQTSTGNRLPFPYDYCINSYARGAEENPEPGAGVRGTDPGPYFGFTPWAAGDPRENVFKPVSLSSIPRASEEWVIADAWYRNDAGGSVWMSQGGTYQYESSGIASVPFAPHNAQRRSYSWSSEQERNAIADSIRSQKSGDGATQAAFFDGHAEPVQSKTFVIGQFDIVYGFPGTVNESADHFSEAQRNVFRQGYWR